MARMRKHRRHLLFGEGFGTVCGMNPNDQNRPQGQPTPPPRAPQSPPPNLYEGQYGQQPSVPNPYASGQYAHQRPAEKDPGFLKYVVPLRASPWAIIASYLGLVSVLLVFAPFALLTGILALNQINNSDKYDGKGRAWFGVIMGALGTIGLIVVIAMQAGR